MSLRTIGFRTHSTHSPVRYRLAGKEGGRGGGEGRGHRSGGGGEGGGNDTKAKISHAFQTHLKRVHAADQQRSVRRQLFACDTTSPLAQQTSPPSGRTDDSPEASRSNVVFPAPFAVGHLSLPSAFSSFPLPPRRPQLTSSSSSSSRRRGGTYRQSIMSGCPAGGPH